MVLIAFPGLLVRLGPCHAVLGPLLECLSVKSLQGSLALDYADNAGWTQEADVQPT